MALQQNGWSWLDGSAEVSIPVWSKIEVSILSPFLFWSARCCSCQFFYSVKEIGEQRSNSKRVKHMHSIEIDCFLRHPKNLDYMRNHFNFFVKFFHLPTSGFFRKIFRKISEFFEKYINFCKPVKFQKIILSHCELVVKGLKKLYMR